MEDREPGNPEHKLLSESSIPSFYVVFAVLLVTFDCLSWVGVRADSNLANSIIDYSVLGISLYGIYKSIKAVKRNPYSCSVITSILLFALLTSSLNLLSVRDFVCIKREFPAGKKTVKALQSINADGETMTEIWLITPLLPGVHKDTNIATIDRSSRIFAEHFEDSARHKQLKIIVTMACSAEKAFVKNIPCD